MAEHTNLAWELPIDPRRLADSLVVRWKQVAVAAAGLAVLGFTWGFVTGRYAATVKLVRSELPALVSPGGPGEGISLRPVSTDDAANLARSPAAVRRAAENAGLPAETEAGAGSLEATLQVNGEIISVTARGRDASQTAALANAYAQEVARITRGIQSNEVQEAHALLQTQLATVDRELEQTSQELVRLLQASKLVDFEKEPTIPLQQWTELNRKCESLSRQIETLNLQIQGLMREVTKYMPALVAAKEALDRAVLRYTEEHPKVRELRATIDALETQAAGRGPPTELDVSSWGNPAAMSLYRQVVDLRGQRIALEKQAEESGELRRQLEQEIDRLPTRQLEYARVRSQFQSLRQNRELLSSRQQKLRLLAGSLAGGHRIVDQAKAEDLGRGEKWHRGLAAGGIAGAAGMLLLFIWLLAAEFADGRIRSSEDLRRATRLPVLGVLGNLAELSEAEQQQWAFRALTALKGRLNPSDGAALVCGFVSATHGEGRSTWIKLLAEAARRIGYQCLTISASMPSGAPAAPEAASDAPPTEQPPTMPALPSEWLTPVPATGTPAIRELSVPSESWTLERRGKWREALQAWQSCENLVVLVELPPAYKSESILLAEHLPHVIWLCGKDMAKVTETRSHLETLRHGRSRLAGSVFNHGAQPL